MHTPRFPSSGPGLGARVAPGTLGDLGPEPAVGLDAAGPAELLKRGF